MLKLERENIEVIQPIDMLEIEWTCNCGDYNSDWFAPETEVPMMQCNNCSRRFYLESEDLLYFLESNDS